MVTSVRRFTAKRGELGKRLSHAHWDGGKGGQKIGLERLDRFEEAAYNQTISLFDDTEK